MVQFRRKISVGVCIFNTCDEMGSGVRPATTPLVSASLSLVRGAISRLMPFRLIRFLQVMVVADLYAKRDH